MTDVRFAGVTELVWPAPRATGHGQRLGCFAKRTYSLREGRLALADEQVPLTLAPELALDADGQYRLLLDDGDLYDGKVATDVVVLGHAHARAPARELGVAVAVKSRVRQLRAVGERRAEVGADGQVRFTPPEPFERLALSPESAYGGVDRHAQQVLDPAAEPSPGEAHPALGPDMLTGVVRARPPGLFAYPRNDVGRAYFLDVDRRRADGARLPLLEDPGDRLTPERFFVSAPSAWIDAPIPGSLGWVHHAFYPRFARLFGDAEPHDPPLRPIRETLLGDGDDLLTLPALTIGSVHPRALQGAAPGLACDRLLGDEPLALHNLHRSIEKLTFELPGEGPRFSLRPPDLRVFTPKPMLQTVRIEPDLDRLTLAWAAFVPLLSAVDDDYLDQCELVVKWARL